MTNLEALRMVRSASIYAGAAVTQMTIHSRAYVKAAKAVINTFEHAERGLEFEVGFEGKEQIKAESEAKANAAFAKFSKSSPWSY